MSDADSDLLTGPQRTARNESKLMILHNRTHGPWYEPEQPAWQGADARARAPHAWCGDPEPWTHQPDRMALARAEPGAFHKSTAERDATARTPGRANMRLLPLRKPSGGALPAPEFERFLERERSLADRGTRTFSLMVLRCRDA